MTPASSSRESSPWVEGRTVGAVLRTTAARWPERDAVVFPALGLRWSWAELDRRVDAVASGLLRLGVARGTHVGIWALSCPEWVVAQFAVARMGAVLVNVNPAFRVQELETVLRLVDVETLIVGTPFKTSDFAAMVESLVPEATRAPAGMWRSERLPHLRCLIALDEGHAAGWRTWRDLEAGGRAVEWDEPAANEVYNIQFTSGTTGMPKGVMLTHRNLLMNVYYVGERLHYTENDRVCVPVPFFHCFGCVLGNLACAITGAALVVPAPSFDPAATLAAIEAERCTSLYGVPTMFIAELNHADRPRRDLSSLRTGIMSGSPCPLPVMQAVMTTLGIPQIACGYGQTEASPLITLTSVDDPIEVRVGTVGRPFPGLEVQLIDPVTRAVVAGDQTGELCVRGHAVMAGYYHNPEATAQAVDSQGWLHTGDLARVRDDGNYRIVGRCKELIIRGGENVYPPEVEEFLCHHPAVAEAAVVGLPDPIYGECVAAWVVLRPDTWAAPDAIRAFCQGQISHFKIPKYIEVVESLPRTLSGKVRKQVLRQQGIVQFGLSESADSAP